MEPTAQCEGSPATQSQSYIHSTFIYIPPTATFNQGRFDQTNQVLHSVEKQVSYPIVHSFYTTIILVKGRKTMITYDPEVGAFRSMWTSYLHKANDNLCWKSCLLELFVICIIFGLSWGWAK